MRKIDLHPDKCAQVWFLCRLKLLSSIQRSIQLSEPEIITTESLFWGNESHSAQRIGGSDSR